MFSEKKRNFSNKIPVASQRAIDGEEEKNLLFTTLAFMTKAPSLKILKRNKNVFFYLQEARYYFLQKGFWS